MIADLKQGNSVLKLVVCVADLWIVKERNGKHHFECLIQDNKVFFPLFTMFPFFNAPNIPANVNFLHSVIKYMSLPKTKISNYGNKGYRSIKLIWFIMVTL